MRQLFRNDPSYAFKRQAPARRFRLPGFAYGMMGIIALGMFVPSTGIVYAEGRDPGAEVDLVADKSASPALPEYRLNVRDRIRIQVYEWRPSRDEVYTWTALNQIYTIDPAGRISLPLAGSVVAAGYTTTELGTLISRQLAERLRLATLPDTTIEVAEFRPIYVIGAVEKPGEYSYTAGMSVLQGVSQSGGLYRNTSAGGMRLEREFVTTAGNFKSLQLERVRLLALKARLEAELADADRIAFPGELWPTDGRQKIHAVNSIMAKEQSVFELRQNAKETQLTALDQLQRSLEDEMATLEKRMATQQKQIDLLKAELDGINQLNQRGLATQPRLLGLQRNLAELEGEMLRIQSDRTRAMQEVSRTKIAKIEYNNKHDNDLTVELQTTEARLQQIVQETLVSQRLLADTRSEAAASPFNASMTVSNSEDPGEQTRVHYTIAREIGGKMVNIEATEATEVRPGDTIKVELQMPPAGLNMFGSRDIDASFPEFDPSSKPALPASVAPAPPEAPHLLPTPTSASIQPTPSATAITP